MQAADVPKDNPEPVESPDAPQEDPEPVESPVVPEENPQPAEPISLWLKRTSTSNLWMEASW